MLKLVQMMANLSDHAPLKRKRRACDTLVVCLSFVSLLFSFWAVTVGWKNTIFNAHGFRQAQTAISAYYMAATGHLALAYELPVLGPPWSIPFELPLYQVIVAKTSRDLYLPLEQAGRLVSIAFFYATFLPLFVLLRGLGLERVPVLVTLALLSVSPHYIFWSRAFMIESTAIFFSVVYLTCVIVATRHSRQLESKTKFQGLALLAAASGSLAGAVKVTTFASFLLAAFAVIVFNAWASRPAVDHRHRKLGLLAGCSLVVPFLFTTWWVRYTDTVKIQNPMGRFLTSYALRSWTFGTLDQRLEPVSYTGFAGIGIGHVIDNFIGNRFIVVIACLLAILAGRRRLQIFLVCIALYASAILIFFNLHFWHSYYAYANGIFLVSAVGLSIGYCLQLGGWKSWLAVYVFAFAIGASVMHYFDEYYRNQHTNAPGRPVVAGILDANTEPNDVVAIYGLDWSPELPYQAHRRAVMAWSLHGDSVVNDSLRQEGVDRIAAVVICGQQRAKSDAIIVNLTRMGLHTPHEVSAEDCLIYLP